MHVYRYSFWKLLAAILCGIGMLWLGHSMTEAHSGKIIFLGYLFLTFASVLIAFCGRFLLSDRIVLRIDPHGIEYKTLIGKERVLWRDFRGADIESVRTGSGMFESTARHLKLNFGKGLLGNCSISEKLLEGGIQIEDMLATLRECMRRAAALDRGDYRHASLGGAGAPAGQVQAAAAAPVVSGFGRKGL